jgi:hypothetical protein
MRGSFGKRSIRDCGCGDMMLISEPEWLPALSGFFLLGMLLPYYFYALMVCVGICALLTWNHYEERVAAFVLSFSLWFALQWGVLIALVSRAPDPSDYRRLIELGIISLTILLFSVCALVSLWLYVMRVPIEPRSKTAIGLGLTLLLAHFLHVIIITFVTALATD